MSGEHLFSLGLSVGFLAGCLFCLVIYGVTKIQNSVKAAKIQEEFDKQVAQAQANRASLPPKQETVAMVFKKPSEDPVSTNSIVGSVAYPVYDDFDDPEPTGRFFRQDLLLIKN